MPFAYLPPNAYYVLSSGDTPLMLACVLLLLAALRWQYRRRKTSRAAAHKTHQRASPPLWHGLTAEAALRELGVTLAAGLSTTEAANRLRLYGANQLQAKPPRSAWFLLFSQFKSLLIVILVAAAVLAATIGDMQDGVVLLVVVVINALLGFYQEFRAEKSLSALKKMLALRAKVRRAGGLVDIAAEQLVCGDIVIVQAGDKIPADGRIMVARTLEADESALTGESMPVAKHQDALPNTNALLAERSNMLYMSTTVTRGRAELLVTATGMDTETGKLAHLLTQQEESATPLQIQLDSLGKRLALIALVVVALLFASALSRGEPLLETAFTAIALAVAAIPEGLAAVVTVTLALGMRRMARQNAIAKRLAAVETLGCTTVICTDKTGTLTVNQMTARTLFYKDTAYQVSGEGYGLSGAITPAQATPTLALTDLLNPIALCNDSRLQGDKVVGDPMEGALLVLAAKGGVNLEAITKQLPRLAEIPFDAEHKFMATFHSDGDHIQVFVKGAPELLLQRCPFGVDAQNQRVAINAAVVAENERMASAGLRVLGVASRALPAAGFLADGDLFGYIEQLTFIALIGLMDPPRPQARDAIALCQQAGISVKMITGDQKITAAAIAQELGLYGEVIEGRELEALADAELAARIKNIAVFARTAPEQKARIIRALKANGEVVAMTGDGVNDAPALKIADIGIAMGITGTDVAQEAATLILTDDNFATIVKAIKEGRGIYENMVKFVRFQLSTNLGAILTVAGAPLLGLPVPFGAVQLLWINIIMDGPPAISLGVDPARSGNMSEPPRRPQARILSLSRFGNLLAYGLAMAAGTLGVFYYGLHGDTPVKAATMAFNTFVLFQVFNVFNARAEKDSAFNPHFFSNRMLWLAMVSVLLLQWLVIQWPPAQRVFHTHALTPTDWLLTGGVASSILVLEELRKGLWRLVRYVVKGRTSK
jgi:Ca2+-transporting ATPase